MKMEDIKTLSHDEISTKILEYKKELLNLRFQLATASLEDTSRVKKVKKNIARLNTVLNQK